MAYGDRPGIAAIFGTENVTKWADLDNTGDPATITTRVNAALDRVTADIEDRLRFGPYAVPFATVPSTIKYLCELGAGLWLYDSRGATDFDENGNARDAYQARRKEYFAAIADILTRRRRFDLEETSVSYPQIVDN